MGMFNESLSDADLYTAQKIGQNMNVRGLISDLRLQRLGNDFFSRGDMSAQGLMDFAQENQMGMKEMNEFLAVAKGFQNFSKQDTGAQAALMKAQADMLSAEAAMKKANKPGSGMILKPEDVAYGPQGGDPIAFGRAAQEKAPTGALANLVWNRDQHKPGSPSYKIFDKAIAKSNYYSTDSAEKVDTLSKKDVFSKYHELGKQLNSIQARVGVASDVLQPDIDATIAGIQNDMGILADTYIQKYNGSPGELGIQTQKTGPVSRGPIPPGQVQGYLDRAGGDKVKAAAMAEKDGWDIR